MKVIYRVLILLVVYIGAVIFFSNGMEEHFFNDDKELVEMAQPTFPLVSLEVEGHEINVLHGYASNLNEMIMRESITPLGSDRTFTVLINENESVVKKLKYEILDENGNELESDSMIVLDTGEERKSVTIRTKENLKAGIEYVAKITLITNQSKRIYYYTKLKLYDNGYLTEKLQFVSDLHNALFDKVKAADYEKYFESSKNSDNSTFASVNIYSSFDMVTYGGLEPIVEYEAVPTITEFYGNMASVRLDYVISAQTEYGQEKYRATEDIRFNYTTSRPYLYNYERKLDVIYNPQNVSLGRSEFKVGITNDTDIQTVANDGEVYYAFVADRKLMLYDSQANELIKVFSFAQDNGNYQRDLYDQHEVKILNVSEEGNVDFYVYGYMNRGEYEGRVGILLYRFYFADMRVEEQAYLPINSSYQLLKYDIGDFVYRNDYDMFFFTMYNTIYSYNIVTKELAVVANDVPSENLVYSEADKYVAWQDCSDVSKAKDIVIMNLEDCSKIVVSAPIDNNIKIFGRINENIVYGFAKHSDIYTYEDGNIFLPPWKLLICNGKGSTLKEYAKSGYYIKDVEIGDNELVIKRVVKNSSDGKYTDGEEDYVLNRKVESTEAFKESKRITDRMLTEYYISLPEKIEITVNPTIKESLVTVISEDATVRVTQPAEEGDVFYAYSFGEIVYASKKASDCVLMADANVGSVINNEGKLVWERGVKSSKSEITSLETMSASSLTSMQACMKMLLTYENVEADTSEFKAKDMTVAKWLAGVMKATPVELTGCTLDEVLYYVYKQRPVIAVLPSGRACIITAYDTSTITVFDPSTYRYDKYSNEQANEMFENAGKRFISILE